MKPGKEKLSDFWGYAIVIIVLYSSIPLMLLLVYDKISEAWRYPTLAVILLMTVIWLGLGMYIESRQGY